MSSAVIHIGCTDQGFLVRIEGRGTLRESLAFYDFIVDCLKCEQLPLAIDLSACEHLDSTFLGCLVKLHHRLSGDSAAGLLIVAPTERAKQLLASMKLDQLLAVTAAAPLVIDEVCSLSATALTTGDLGRHAVDCHRQLAALGGPHQAIFESIARQLEEELAGEE